ncbi:MAG: hypothetical protein ACREFP_10355, partial [Acetobacteraceae bacterium]
PTPLPEGEGKRSDVSAFMESMCWSASGGPTGLLSISDYDREGSNERPSPDAPRELLLRGLAGDRACLVAVSI